MARKKAVIQKEWDAAAAELDAAIADCDGGNVTAAALSAFEKTLASWKKLLKEAKDKVERWGDEEDKDRQKFKTFVATQEKMDGRYDTKLQTAGKDAVAFKARMKKAEEAEKLLDQQWKQAGFAVEQAEERMGKAEAAAKQKNVALAVKESGVVSGKLKDLSRGYLTKVRLEAILKLVATQAKLGRDDVDCLEPAARKEQARLRKLAEKVGDRVGKLDEKMEAMIEAWADSDGETSSADPTYKANLQKSKKLYKIASDAAKKELAACGILGKQITALRGMLAQVKDENVEPVVKQVLTQVKHLDDSFRALDSGIQNTIREATSKYSKQVTAWGITTEDRVKNLGPLQDLAFSCNYKAQVIRNDGKEEAAAILGQLVSRFNSDMARRALAGIEAMPVRDAA